MSAFQAYNSGKKKTAISIVYSPQNINNNENNSSRLFYCKTAKVFATYNVFVYYTNSFLFCQVFYPISTITFA